MWRVPAYEHCRTQTVSSENESAYLSEFRMMAEAEPVSRTLWVIAHLTVGNERAVRDELETLAENSVSDWSNPVWDIKHNQLMDPILERDAFARLRDRMGYE